MNLTTIAGFLLVILCAGIMAAFYFTNRARPYRGLRVIPAFSRLRRAIGMAVEDGSGMHVSMGAAGLLSPNAATALVGMAMLERVAQLSSASDRPPLATSGDPTLALLSQDTLQHTFRQSNLSDEYDPAQGRLTGFTPFSYIAGTMPIVRDEHISANVVIGNFGPEVGLLADAADQANACFLAGSDSLTAQAVLFASAQDPLLGEEVFAGGAYLQAGAMHAASLHAQDVLRWVLIGFLIGGSLLKLVGIL